MTLSLEHEFIETNGIRLHVVCAGPEDGPLVVLLHGFPEFWYGWRKQIAALVDAGLRVVVPDQRGYNLSGKPREVKAYNIDVLAADVVGLIGAVGRNRASLVGHDWGGAVAWWVATRYPQHVDRLAILNMPHPWVMKRTLERSWRQRRRSWYILFFQLPLLPEWALRRGNWRVLTRALRASAHREAFTDADLERYTEAWSQPSALRSMLNWYRAAMRFPPKAIERPAVAAPTLIIWGAQDRFLGRDMATQSIDICRDGRLVFLEQETHWLQHEAAGRVNALLQEFFRDERSSEIVR